MAKGIITCLIAGQYTIYDTITSQTHIAKPRGVFRIKGVSPKVGDYVEYSTGSGDATITKIEKRTTDLVRPAVCNISQAFVVFSVKEPDLNLNLLDRFITILEFYNIKPILVFNKWDLLTSSTEKNEVENVINYYKKIGYDTVITSAKATLIDEIIPYIDNNISVITGQSGVGKSSIINVLDPSISIKTNEISKALNRGKHTTRHVELLKINEGWIADTPGFGTMEFIDMDEKDISHSFIEFFENSNKCKYNGCLHQNEPLCEIKRLVEKKEILPSRYENYLQFISEIKSKRKW